MQFIISLLPLAYGHPWSNVHQECIVFLLSRSEGLAAIAKGVRSIGT